MATFGMRTWHCEFIKEGMQLLGAMQALAASQGNNWPRRQKVLEALLYRRGLLPAEGYSMGGLREGVRATLLRRAEGKGKFLGMRDVEGSNLPDEVLDAVGDLRVALVLTPPKQGWNPNGKQHLTFSNSSASEKNITLARFPNWPFPHCTECKPTASFAEPWWHWPQERQEDVLFLLFPRVAARKFKLVSDEFVLASILSFYNLTGPDWQTDGSSSHVDWRHAQGDGHPGQYNKSAILQDSEALVQVRLRQSVPESKEAFRA
jgi:hypothetical protein